MQGDASLVSDVVVVVCSTAAGGLLAARLGQPLLLGFLISGMAAGPHGADMIHEVIQTEALAQLGVALILFSLGIELDLTRIAHVR
jgi:CPA2 family monovalent cation:H+ antiporter-2